MKKIYIIGAFACMFAACKPSVDITTPPLPGDADFTTYMAVGNSLTAGYADGSLYVTGQYNSYPFRLYEQLSKIKVNGGATGGFYQPYLKTDNGYPGPRLVMGYVPKCTGGSVLSPVNLPTFAPDVSDAQPYVSTGPNGQINNIAVPGVRVADYPVVGYADATNPIHNPYAARFYSTPSNSPLEELDYRERNLHPTFFTMWLGANDVLGYALAGGQGNGSLVAPPLIGNYYNTSDITPSAVFETTYNAAVDLATRHGAQGMLLNIPDITSIPYFTTIKADGLYIPRQSLADSLTAYYASMNYVFTLGYNYFIISDNAGSTRQAVPGELILLNTPMDSIVCAAWGSFKAIPKEYVLTTDEIQNIRIATSLYNQTIRGAATRYNLGFTDIAAYMTTLASGITYNGINYNATFIKGGAFSLDGIHLNPRGYALIANKIISDINAKYHSKVNTVDVNQYNGIQFP